jgi:hypothetical protein
MASSRVDLPVPFSPIKKVTGDVSAISSMSRMAGMEKGYSLKDGTPLRFSVTALTNKSAIRAPLPFELPVTNSPVTVAQPRRAEQRL